MSIEIRIFETTAEDVRDQLVALASMMGGPAITAPGQPEVKAPEAAEDKAPETTKPKTRRTRKAAAKDEAKEEAKEEAKDEAKATGMTYEADVRPVLIEVANQVEDGRTKVVGLLSKYGVKHGAKLSSAALPKVKAEAEKMLEEVEQPENEEFEL